MSLYRKGGITTLNEQSETERLIYRARLWMGEGRDDLALATLEEIQTGDSEQQHQIAYLCAWCYTKLERWTEALRLLSPLYTQSSIEDNWNDANHNERERDRKSTRLNSSHMSI